MSYRKFPIIISFEDFDNDIKPLIKEIRPNWDIANLKTMRMQGGVSNVLYGVHCDDQFNDGKTDMILVRVYGKILLDRDIEMVNMSALSKYSLAAKVWGQFSNGCCYQFIHGTVLDVRSVWEPGMYKLIINEFARLHTVKLDIDRPKKPFVFNKMREMANHLPLCLADAVKNDIYHQKFPSKERIFTEIDELELELVNLDCPVTFCHNDLIVRNMVLNSEKNRIHLIDFEYADYNYSAFDIANHFNEFAGLDIIDYSQYPDKSFQMVWLRQYLETLYLYKQINGDNINDVVKDTDVEHWFRMVNKFSLSSHLLWCIWGIWQHVHSHIIFDYLDYSIIRWNQYISKKEEFLAL